MKHYKIVHKKPFIPHGFGKRRRKKLSLQLKILKIQKKPQPLKKQFMVTNHDFDAVREYLYNALPGFFQR